MNIYTKHRPNFHQLESFHESECTDPSANAFLQIYGIFKNTFTFTSGNICDFISTLKIILRVEKTFETTIQKNLKFARKISVTEFRYGETTHLGFTEILFHSYLDKKVTSKKVCSLHKVMCNGMVSLGGGYI